MKMDALLTQLAGAGPQPQWGRQAAGRADGAGFADALRALSQAAEPAAGMPNTAAPIDVQRLATQPLSVLTLAHELLQPRAAGDLQAIEVEAAITEPAADGETEPVMTALLALMQASIDNRNKPGATTPPANLATPAAVTGASLAGSRGSDTAAEAAVISSRQSAPGVTYAPAVAGTATMPLSVTDGGDTPANLTATPLAQASFQAATTEAGAAASDNNGLPVTVRASMMALSDGAQSNGAATPQVSPLTAATTTASGMAQPAQATLSTPLQSPDWGRDLGSQLVQMTQRGDQQITLQLNPQDLGPLSVELRVSDQLAQLSLLATSAQVRGALEQALPQLREALAEQGITLGEANVGEGGAEAQNRDDGRQPGMLAEQPDAADDNVAANDHGGIDAATRNLEAGRINLYI